MGPFKLSRLTSYLAVYIVLSASFMLQVRNALTARFGDEGLFLFLKAVFGVVAVTVLGACFVRRLPWHRVPAALAVLYLAWNLILRQPFLTEQLHVLTYGLLGFCAARDLIRTDAPSAREVFFSAAFICVVSVSDEFFQAVLAYRRGDIRDIVTNILGGLLGIVLLWFLRRPSAFTPS